MCSRFDDYDSDEDTEVQNITGGSDSDGLPDPHRYREDLDGAGPSRGGRSSRGSNPCTDTESRPGTPSTHSCSRPGIPSQFSGRATPSISGAHRPGVVARLNRAPSVEPASQSVHNELGSTTRWWNGIPVTHDVIEHWRPPEPAEQSEAWEVSLLTDFLIAL